jgi:hypothetical protein
MNFIYLLFAFLSATSASPILHRTLETPFMQMDKDCWMFSDKKFVCDDINIVIEYDPDSMDDVKTVCNQSSINNFTNDDFAHLINSRLKQYYIPCVVHTINDLGSTQLKKHCSEMYADKC